MIRPREREASIYRSVFVYVCIRERVIRLFPSPRVYVYRIPGVPSGAWKFIPYIPHKNDKGENVAETNLREGERERKRRKEREREYVCYVRACVSDRQREERDTNRERERGKK